MGYREIMRIGKKITRTSSVYIAAGQESKVTKIYWTRFYAIEFDSVIGFYLIYSGFYLAFK